MLIAPILALPLLMVAGRDDPRPAPAVDPSEAFFARPEIPRIRIRVEAEPLEKLKADARNYVKATIQEDDGPVIADVAIKLKGAAGSFREWDDRPALTLNMRKFRKGGEFHGLVKFHLNNSVQDETYLHELLCSELFRKVGVPTPRVTYARVWLNDRDAGLYVLKEGFDKPFLKRSFADPSGNLYDGGFLQDLDAELEKDEGDGPNDRSDLRAIVEAANDPDPAERARRVEELVDMDEFLTFMAMERMTCHWDGYSNKANNYRVYFDPRSKKAIFLPHGMDQMFAETEMGLFDPSDILIPRTVLGNDSLRRRYRERLKKLIPLMSPADDLIRRLDEADRRLRPVVEAMDREFAERRSAQVAELKDRLIARAANLIKQIDEPEEVAQEFDERGVSKLAGWSMVNENEQAALDEVADETGKKSLSIRVAGEEPCVASWRRRVLLSPGVYTLRAAVRTDRVVRPDEGEEGGVGVGISGTPRDQHLAGTVTRKVLSCSFRVTEDRTAVVLVLELRARSGQVWFESDSLELVRTDGGDER